MYMLPYYDESTVFSSLLCMHPLQYTGWKHHHVADSALARQHHTRSGGNNTPSGQGRCEEQIHYQELCEAGTSPLCMYMYTCT